MQIDYGPLKTAMKTWGDNMNNIVKPMLQQLENGWRIQLVEEDGSELVKYFFNQKFDDCVNWAAAQLRSWPECRRMAWDMWDFTHREDAEKFITLFHLSWHQ